MAHLYDYLHDVLSISGLTNRLPGWITSGLYIMDIQIILTIILGFGACLYVLKRIGRQFHQSNAESLCEECDVEQRTGSIEE